MPIVEYAEAILEDNEEAILEDNAEVILEDNAGEVINIEEYNEADFIIPEDEELAIWEENYDNEEEHEHEAPYAPIPENIMANLPQVNEDEICVVCRDGPRTHALIPCGHRVLCINCLWQLERQSCPLCNSNFTSFLRIW
ncbi:unnamed protein product [Macrosiphum euphorbiae]|uniref:RING-type domain-containing protein n=1 Tax=Macrosiphum euphorbiae TaxID=13131 RepID=A0AAV0YA30_9HEMI|nr:unnamed protein product [Macrosiphum euphorbiae]